MAIAVYWTPQTTNPTLWTPGEPPTAFLLQQDSAFILLQDGGYIGLQ